MSDSFQTRQSISGGRTFMVTDPFLDIKSVNLVLEGARGVPEGLVKMATRGRPDDQSSHSGFKARARRASRASGTGRPWWMTWYTCSEMGISTPTLAESSCTDAAVTTPSAT